MVRVVAYTMVASLLTSCVSYRYNLEHAYVSPDAKLSRSEVEQIVQTVTEKSRLMIIGITRWHHEDRDEVIVYTDLAEEGLMVYHLERSTGGPWRIVSSGQGLVMAL
jgi:hypothetical protein